MLNPGDLLIWPDRTKYWDWQYLGNNQFKIIASRKKSICQVGLVRTYDSYSWASAGWKIIPVKEYNFDKLYLRLK